jgi:transposase
MDMVVALSAATVNGLVEARQVAFRLSDLLELGERRRVPEVAARLGVSVATLYRWLHAFILAGADSLRPRRPPGQADAGQKARLYEAAVAGPPEAGYPRT